MQWLNGWRPAAVVFDCDGILMDTESCWTVAETAMFAKHGFSFTLDDKASLLGRSTPDAALVMAGKFGKPPQAAAQIEAELLVNAAQAIDIGGRAMPGALRIVEMLRGRLPLAVASNANRVMLDTALRRGGFDGLISISVAADEVHSPKPSPMIYLEACRRLGVPPERVLAFEDSITGLRSAQAAGLKVVGIPTLKAREFPADLVFDALTDERLLAWVGAWGSAGNAA
jgi:beta-phosphoglucomutase-like phosphatase (HAD superfamily)